MANYEIKDSDNVVVNTIVCTDENFIKSAFPDCTFSIVEPVKAPNLTAEEEARIWRNSELASTDQAAQVPDWPNRANILTYRTALRDWPSTSDFPATKPTL
jgi:hypothetical protein